ncbi:YraN family protein [Sinanaerobacter sp. ZZT-01]|uniref:YraN family protein n=1 Tax=Sinanaerobacter sp. ZZT-01 TaxID=3111540 RepID=UPI002D76C7ED|nr:YraN family protein [Sinanaerobacter sp. ZZT-01]WRR92659.1 YraN family protein [Sinanaerobacter sp. ZZT-01]
MKLGKWGEETAASYLLKNGYRILDKNYTCRFGELDLIVQKEKQICFVEVKTRRSLQFGEPCESITKKKQKHIHKSIQVYLMNRKLNNYELRIDVIELLLLDKKIYLRHIKNAF